MTYSTNGVTSEFMLTLRLARVLSKEYTEDRAREVAYHAENGHRPQHCIHGTNQWTDYDNICGGCEDGVTMLNMAVRDAADAVSEQTKRIKWAQGAPHILTPEVRNSIWEWAFEPVMRYSHLLNK